MLDSLDAEIGVPLVTTWIKLLGTNLIMPRGEPFKVDLVSDAKCQDRVFAAVAPTNKRHQINKLTWRSFLQLNKINNKPLQESFPPEG